MATVELAASSIYPTNIVYYWRFEGNLGAAVGSNTGTGTNISYNASYGVYGQGAGFGGNSVASFTAPSTMTTGAMYGWVRANSSTTNPIFWSCRSETSGNGTFQLYQNASGNKVTLLVHNGTTWVVNITSANAVDTNYHCYIWEWGSFGHQLYIDGILAASTTTTCSVFASSTPILIGRLYNNDGALSGHQDDLAIFNAPLGEEKRAILMGLPFSGGNTIPMLFGGGATIS
jgi:hypothetical protein